MKLSHVLLPCKMSSTRIPRKNLAMVGHRTLLDLAIDRFQSWFPEAQICVATEDSDVARHSSRRGCTGFPLTLADREDRRTVSELFNDWLTDKSADERCLCAQLTSPFAFRSEFLRAVHDPRPYVSSAWIGQLHLRPITSNRQHHWLVTSQNLPATALITGNFGVAWGQHQATPAEVVTCLSPVSWLSAIDINTPTDLDLARKIAHGLNWNMLDDSSTPRRHLQFQESRHDA